MHSLFDHPLFRRGEFFLVWFAGFAIPALWVLRAGYDVNWDLRNYHYYGGYALLTGRFDTDWIAANAQTFINPLPYVPFYYLIETASPLVASLILALVSGLNFALLYYLARGLIHGESVLRARLLAFGIAAGGCTAPIYLGTSAASFLDGYTSVLILAALLLLCRDAAAEGRTRRWPVFLLVGLLLGLSVGAKLTNAIYALAMTVTLVLLWRPLHLSGRAFGAYALGGTVGALLLHAHWSVFLWTRFGSPLFPFFNQVFRSPLAEFIDYRDRRFLPNSVLDALAYPWLFLIGAHPSAEIYFRDARFALVFVLLAAAVAMLARRRLGAAGQAPRPRGTVPGAQLLLVVVFCLAAYAIWISAFGISRYFVPIELLALVVAYLLIDHLAGATRIRFWATIGCVALAVITTVPPRWLRVSLFSPPYASDNWFGLMVPEALKAEGILFVMTGPQPSAFVIPRLPPSSTFVRIESNFPRLRKIRLGALAAERIGDHVGPIRSLHIGRRGERYAEMLADFGLVEDRDRCLKTRWYYEEISSCALSRMP